jgi:2-amino-4-hydroxy-6-hydroxymethyldihydropteridine diphosphokinase
MAKVKCYLGLGSNIESSSSSRADFLLSAVRQLAQFESVDLVSASHIYDTSPVGYDSQENFYNAVVCIETTLSPKELLRACLEVVEKRAGRIRTTENGPRTLDVDILLYGDETVDEPDLQIPHPRMYERAFVLVPLNEIAPELVGDISSYSLVDNLEEVKKLEINFKKIIDSYKES